MITPEQLVTNLTDQVSKLEKELEEAQQDIKDFEKLAHEWKEGWEKTERDLKIKLANAQQTIEQLEKDYVYVIKHSDGDF